MAMIAKEAQFIIELRRRGIARMTPFITDIFTDIAEELNVSYQAIFERLMRGEVVTSVAIRRDYNYLISEGATADAGVWNCIPGEGADGTRLLTYLTVLDRMIRAMFEAKPPVVAPHVLPEA